MDDALTLDGTSVPVRATPVLVMLLVVALLALRCMPKTSTMLLVGALMLTPVAVAQYPAVTNVTFQV